MGSNLSDDFSVNYPSDDFAGNYQKDGFTYNYQKYDSPLIVGRTVLRVVLNNTI